MLAGVSPNLHEVAIDDGANLFKRIWHIDIPSISFNLSGVTFPNDEGMDRQELLRQIDEGVPPFENSGALDVKLQPIKFKGEDAIECRVNGRQIGFVPKTMVPDVLAAMKKPDATISGFHVVGGLDGLNYGVGMAVRFTDPQKVKR